MALKFTVSMLSNNLICDLPVIFCNVLGLSKIAFNDTPKLGILNFNFFSPFILSTKLNFNFLLEKIPLNSNSCIVLSNFSLKSTFSN